MILFLEVNTKRVLAYVFYSYRFIGFIILILGVVGLFVPRVFGWIVLTTLFYYYAACFIYITILKYVLSWNYYLFVILPLTMIGLMHMKEIRIRFRIKDSIVVHVNLISVLIALILTYIYGYLFIHYNRSILEIVDKLM